MTPQQVTLLRSLPSVDKLMAEQAVDGLVATYGRELVVEAARETVDGLRVQIRDGAAERVDSAEMVNNMQQWLLDLLAPTLLPVINATGVIVHTNLGRAPLSDGALAAIDAIGRGYSNLEYNLEPGVRGSRSTHASGLVQRITGAEAATVVNNAASAVLLMLSALCAGKEVIVSRGQLVEIGGGFRMPDVMRQAGVKLVEVGTTNRTHVRDYEAAITDETAAIMSIHHSNYRIIGFTTEPSSAELATLAHAHGLPMLYDQGSGALIDTAQFGLERESLVQDAVSAGCDVIAFSGDKLIGGPQAGIIAGNAPYIAKIKRHPLARAVRPDKLAYAGLGATLTSYVTGNALSEVPVWMMLSQSLEQIEQTARDWCDVLLAKGVSAEVLQGESTVGGGSLPGQTVPTWLLALAPPSPDKLAQKLRMSEAAVVGRIQADKLVFDPRTVLPHQQDQFLITLLAAV